VALAFVLVASLVLPAEAGDVAGTGAAARRPAGVQVVPGVYRLNGTDPGLPAADLEPLRRIVGNAQVVSLGESEHTVGGFHEAKDRMIRFLVAKLGFRAFALENNWEPAERLARYVDSCEGTPEDALRDVYPAWQSAEMARLVRWMCDWNQGHPDDRVHLFGFDVQQPSLDGRALLAFLGRLGFGSDHPWLAAVRACDGVSGPRSAGPIPDEAYQPCMAALDAIGRHFDENAGEIVRQTSATDLQWARLRLLGLRAWEGEVHFPSDQRAHWESRDGAMATAFKAIHDLRAPGARTILWAHNAHIWESPHPTFYGARMMGSRLHEMYGRAYVSIGLVGWTVEIDDLESCGPIEQPPADSVEARLESLRQDFLLADLANPARPPFFANNRLYDLYFARVRPRLYFDALVWLRHARKMEPLFWPPCE
jgi:erythromycin esterase